MGATLDAGAGPRVVRVLPDVPAIDKEFDYLVPDGAQVGLGDVVRIELHGRRVGGWIVAVDVEPEPGVVLKPLAKVSGQGPAPELLELATWAAWRWAGRRASFLRTAAPPGVARVRTGTASVARGPGPDEDPGAGAGAGATAGDVATSGDALHARALGADQGVLRLGPAADRYPLVLAATEGRGGQTLVLCPSVDEARALGQRLRRDGRRVAIVAADGPGSAATGEWIHAATTADVVVGARAAAWAPAPRLARVLVLDEHDEAYQQEQSPTWHARDVIAERARRAGVPCLLVSPCPTLEALAWGELVDAGRGAERGAWPRVEVVDQRELDPSLGPLFSPRLVELVRGDGRVLCILNRTGRARLLACASCRTIARCEVCDAAVGIDAVAEAGEATQLVCGRCGATRPQVCLECGAASFKNLRLGVSRAREELEALAGHPVHEVTATTPADDPGLRTARILVGTEALLHRVPRADAVAFLDMDQELLALRYRAAEQAMALLARAARAVARGGGRDGRVLVQTRTPDHPALVAARSGDPARLVRSEAPMRQALGLPPTTAMAVVAGEAAAAYVEALGHPLGVRVQGPLDGAWRLRAPDHRTLCDALAAVARPPGRLRLEVDPLRI